MATFNVIGGKYAIQTISAVGTTNVTISSATFVSGDFGTKQRIVSLYSSANVFKGIAWVRRFVSTTVLELENQFVDPVTGLFATQVVGDKVLVSKNISEIVVAGITWDSVNRVSNLTSGLDIGTAAITGIYQDTTGTSTVLTISGFDPNSAVYVEDNNAVKKLYLASSSGSVVIYIPPTATAPWYYAVEKYGNQRQSDYFTFLGGQKAIVVKAIPDTGITQSNQTTVSAYSNLETPDKIYDFVAFLRLSEPHISYGQIVFKNGQSLDLQDSSMLVNQSAAAVASFNFSTKLLTIKSTSLSSGVTYNKIIATPPKTITANTNEVISVNIEDANGDSSVTIQGGSGNFTLWKIPNSTPEDDFATGTNLGNITNTTYRFIHLDWFKIVVRDNTTGFRQVVSMAKGNYTVGLFFGDQVQLAQAPTVNQINNKVDTLAVNLEAIKGTGFAKDTHSLVNIAANTDSIPADVWDNETRTLTSAGSSGATLAEIEASTVLAKESTSQSVKTTVEALQNYDDSVLVGKVEAIGLPMQAVDYLEPDNASIEQILSKVESLENTDLTGIATTNDVANSKTEILTAISGIPETDISTLALESTSQSIKNKVDNLPTMEELEATQILALKSDLIIINENVIDSSLLIPAIKKIL